VTRLRKAGFRARRAEEGLPDWRARGLPVSIGSHDKKAARSESRRRKIATRA
jgi:hypothetical protein